MTKVVISPEETTPTQRRYRAAARGHESVGATPGAALDALAEQLPEDQRGSFVIVQSQQPDQYFTAAQQRRLMELLAIRRQSQNQNKAMDPAEQAELESLVDLELDGATKRSAAMLKELQS